MSLIIVYSSMTITRPKPVTSCCSACPEAGAANADDSMPWWLSCPSHHMGDNGLSEHRVKRVRDKVIPVSKNRRILRATASPERRWRRFLTGETQNENSRGGVRHGSE
jgi:hypothetical protein